MEIIQFFEASETANQCTVQYIPQSLGMATRSTTFDTERAPESVIIQLSIFAKVCGVNSIFQKLNEGNAV
jgi:hypothetical protein